MKILWIHDRAHGTGGAERYITQVAQSLKRFGIQSELLYGPGNSQPEFLNQFDQAWPALDLEKQIAKSKADLIYVHRMPQGSSIKPVLESGIPTMRFYHDHQLFCLREHKYTAITQTTCTRPVGLHCYGCLGFVQRKAEGGLQLRSVNHCQQEIQQTRQCDQAIVASRYMQAHLIAHGFEAERIQRIPLFAEPAQAIELEPAIDPAQLLFVGQLVTGKGLDILLQALKQVPQAKLTIIGQGRQESEYRQLSSKLGLESRVAFMGAVNPDQLQHFYRHAAIVVIPSRAPETFGLVGVEAMAYGKPVIASQVGGTSDWLRHGKNGLNFRSGDAKSLAVAIQSLISHSALAHKMGQQGYQMWQKEFRLNTHIESLLMLMHELLYKTYAMPKELAQ